MLFLAFVIRHGNTWVFGRNIDMNKMEIRARVEHFLFMAFNYFYLEFDLVWNLNKKISNIDVRIFLGSICFCLATWIMIANFLTNYTWILLLYKRFETSLLCLSWSSIWERRLNLIHWWWTQQGIVESKVEQFFLRILHGITYVK